MDRIAELMRHETAGDPMTSLKWTHKTTAKIAKELSTLGIEVSANTVSRLLQQMGYSLKVNHKQLARVSKTPPADRNAQFIYIDKLRKNCAAAGAPIISIDTKKKEAIGQFKNDGTAWNREPIAVNDHDFLSDAIGQAVPYGVYDMEANCGAVFVGDSKDTAEFAVDSIEAWWLTVGDDRYDGVKELTILADGGGSNGSNNRLWKHTIQKQLANRHGLTVTVAH